jgi:4-hydroxy-tetrahydrodipicolinate reductase
MSVPLKLTLFGANGRMGKELRALIKEDPGLAYACGIDRQETIEQDMPPQEEKTLPLSEGLREPTDVVIDFSQPSAFMELLGALRSHPLPLVSGTTGLLEGHRQEILGLSRSVPVVWASNFSKLGNLMVFLAGEIARIADTEDLEILEAHHKGKKDAPSGTALSLFEALKQKNPTLRPVFSRHGDGMKRAEGEVAILAVRGGDVVGDHTLFCFGEGERLELAHRAQSRKAFAKGALLAAKWIHGKPPGIYTMADVLGLPSLTNNE